MEDGFSRTLGKRAFHVPAFGILEGADYGPFDLFDTELPEEVTRRAAACLRGESAVDRLVRAPGADYMRFREDQQTDGPIFLFCSVHAAHRTSCMLREHVTQTASKLWLNGRLVNAHGLYLDERQFLDMEKGDNLLVIGLPAARPTVTVSLRISRTEAELVPGPGSFCGDNYQLGEQLAHIVWDHVCMPEDRRFTCMLIPTDTRLVDPSRPVKWTLVRPYVDRPEDYAATMGPCTFYQTYTVDLSPWDYDHVETANNIGMRFDYTLTSGEERVLYADLFLHDPQAALTNYTDLAREALASDWPSDYDKWMLTYYLQQLAYPHPDAQMNVFYLARGIRWCLDEAHTDAHNEGALNIPDNRWRYFRSTLDQCIDQCLVTLPEGYDPSRCYPLLLVFATGRYSSDGCVLRAYTDEPLIIADVSGKGVTMGAYVGEAAIWETVEWLCETYPVDRDRIYAMGYSNGATAAWEQAKIYPHRFAAIFTVAGRVSARGFGNVGNLRVLNLLSADDPMCLPFRQAEKLLRRQRGYTGVWAESMDHGDLGWMRGKKWYLDEMLRVTRQPYPDRIAYSTTRNHHRKAYWLEIHAIAFGKREAAITAVVEAGTIRVTTRNVTGFTITLPPQVPRDQFTVVVNRGKPWAFTAYAEETVHFIRKGRAYVPAAARPAGPVSRKGTGLLDVYLGPMRIAVADPDNRALMRAAEAFSAPVTNGYDGTIYVRYPIVPAGELTAADKACHLIVLDDLSGEGGWLSEVRARCPIRMDAAGITYRDQRREGAYCSMQVIPNPAAQERSILHIGVNDPALLRRNLFTRKVVIPSYLNGHHPYWNEEGLLYMDNTYYGIYEWGMDLEEIIP